MVRKRVVDSTIKPCNHVAMQPDLYALLNTATLVIDRQGFEVFLKHTKHSHRVIALPHIAPGNEGG